MTKLHLVLQAKGGVGKSTVAALLAQYQLDRHGKAAACIDIDPQNKSFSGWRAFGVRHIDISSQGDIDRARFDDVVNAITASDGDVIVDVGANGYTGFTDYMQTDQVIGGLARRGRETVIHTIVVKGSEFDDTMDGLGFLSTTFTVPIVVWVNAMRGAVTNGDGIPFAQLPLTRRLVDEERLRLISMPDYTHNRSTTFSRDLRRVFQERLTFAEAESAWNDEIMVAQRIGIMRDSFFAAIAAADPEGELL